MIELLVVLIIVAILLTIAVASFLGYRQRGGEAAAEANVRTALPALTTYFSDNDTYVGMSVSALSIYDQTLSPTLSFPTLTATTYCVQEIIDGISAHQNGPGGEIVLGTC